MELLIVVEEVDHQVLRTLHEQVNGKYRVVVALDKSAMRGLDYRSDGIPITLVLAKSFDNKREAAQGLSRVGRFGDACRRVQFKDTPLIDVKAHTAYKMKLFKFIEAMQRKPVQMKQVLVKEIIVPE